MTERLERKPRSKKDEFRRSDLHLRRKWIEKNRSSFKKSEITRVARGLVAIGEKSNNIFDVFDGAKLYAIAGEGYKIAPRLAKDYERFDNWGAPHEEIDSFIHEYATDPKLKSKYNRPRHGGAGGSWGTDSQADKRRSIEGRFVFPLLMLGGVVLSLSSLTTTGNAIGNLMGTDRGLVGIFILLIGLVGMLFHKYVW